MAAVAGTAAQCSPIGLLAQLRILFVYNKLTICSSNNKHTVTGVFIYANRVCGTRSQLICNAPPQILLLSLIHVLFVCSIVRPSIRLSCLVCPFCSTNRSFCLRLFCLHSVDCLRFLQTDHDFDRCTYTRLDHIFQNQTIIFKHRPEVQPKTLKEDLPKFFNKIGIQIH